MENATRRILRLHAQPAISSSDWENCSITLDVLLEPNGMIRPNVAYFGVWGAIGSNDPMPFTLLRDGTIDFGCGYENEERFASTNLLNRHIQTDEYFTLTKSGDELTLRIAKISDLTE